MHSCTAIRVGVIASACRIYFLKSLDLFLFIFLVIFFLISKLFFFFIDIFFLLSRIFASSGNKISSLHSSVHLTSFFFLFPCTFFFIINFILSWDKRIYQPSSVSLHSLATAHFPWPEVLLLASQTSKPSASVPCTFYSIQCPPLFQMLPLHLPMRITNGAQVRTATKLFEKVTVKYINHPIHL